MFIKTPISELKPGMYVCGFEKAVGAPITFMNILLVKDDREVERYGAMGYLIAYVVETEKRPLPPIIRPMVGGPTAATGRPKEAAGAIDDPHGRADLDTDKQAIENDKTPSIDAGRASDGKDGAKADPLRENAKKENDIYEGNSVVVEADEKSAPRQGQLRERAKPDDKKAALPDFDGSEEDGGDLSGAAPREGAGKETRSGAAGKTGAASPEKDSRKAGPTGPRASKEDGSHSDDGVIDAGAPVEEGAEEHGVAAREDEKTAKRAKSAGGAIDAVSPVKDGRESRPTGPRASASKDDGSDSDDGVIDAGAPVNDGREARPTGPSADKEEGSRSDEGVIDAGAPVEDGEDEGKGGAREDEKRTERADSVASVIEIGSTARAGRGQENGGGLFGTSGRQDVANEWHGEDKLPFNEELDAAVGIRNEAEVVVRGFMTDARMGKSLDARPVYTAVEKMIDSLFRNRNAITSLTRLKTHDEYTFGHCLNVSLLSLSVGKLMGLDKNSLMSLGMGGMLHDVGKMFVAEDLIRKTSALTDEEFVVMRGHVETGYAYLSKTKGIPEDALYVTLQHHERYNGGGYPRKTPGEKIHLYAAIAAVADVYDAMTSTRTYQKKMLPDYVLRWMYVVRKTHFAPGMVERLVKCLGIYPIGTHVILSTGEVAVVTMGNPENPLRPRVKVVLDSHSMPRNTEEEIDLAYDDGRGVVGCVNDEDLGIAEDPHAPPPPAVLPPKPASGQ